MSQKNIPNVSDRRLSRRLPLRREVTLALSDAGTKQALMLDVSLGGTGVLSRVPVEAGSTLYLMAELPVGDVAESFSAQCRVASSIPINSPDGTLLGLEFIALSDSCRKTLAQFVRRY